GMSPWGIAAGRVMASSRSARPSRAAFSVFSSVLFIIRSPLRFGMDENLSGQYRLSRQAECAALPWISAKVRLTSPPPLWDNKENDLRREEQRSYGNFKRCG